MQTIASFSDSFEANLAKAQLESEGFKVFLANERTTDIAWHLTAAFGGIELQVADEDAKEARAILAANKTHPPDTHAADEIEMPSTVREQLADRALRGALFSMLLLPIHFYISWMLIKVFVSNDRLLPQHRRNAIIAAVINVPCIYLMLSFLAGYLPKK